MKRTVLVTGASGNIGGAIARAFAAGGDRVVLGCYRGKPAAEALRAAIEHQGGEALVCVGNVVEEGEVAGLFARAEEHFGPVEVLVNCAGIQQQKLFCETTVADWHAVMDVHATGAFLCSRRALGSMIEKKRGCIINVASMWGQVGASCEVAYSAAKAALIGMTKALAKEVAPSGIRVNCVSPGAIEGGMMAGFSAADKAQLCEDIPQGRLGTPEEVAQTAVFLASTGAGYLTGQVLGVNGGFVV